ncbi:MAG TPA: DUF2961 domain-containing protein, partial [Terriglobales bacterium]|nr:DUF2961 domain-containing protein [Terriglobales bacterium]
MRLLIILLLTVASANAQNWGAALSDLSKPKGYRLRRSSSYDRTGGNADARRVAPGDSITVFDEAGPGEISHIWFTIADKEEKHLKKIVLRAYWDGEDTPSIEAPIGDFFGLGNGEYFLYQSAPLA